METAYYTIITTTLGNIILIKTTKGLLKLSFIGDNHNHFINDFLRTYPYDLRNKDNLFSDEQEQIKEYFTGVRQNFEIILDKTLVQGYQDKVLKQVETIPYSETRSYKEIAELTGSTGAAQAVGTACARNPLPLIIPCHRVINSNGDLGEYIGGKGMKKELIALEQMFYKNNIKTI